MPNACFGAVGVLRQYAIIIVQRHRPCVAVAIRLIINKSGAVPPAVCCHVYVVRRNWLAEPKGDVLVAPVRHSGVVELRCCGGGDVAASVGAKLRHEQAVGRCWVTVALQLVPFTPGPINWKVDFCRAGADRQISIVHACRASKVKPYVLRSPCV